MAEAFGGCSGHYFGWRLRVLTMNLMRGCAAVTSVTALVAVPASARAVPPAVVCTSIASLIPCPVFGAHPAQIYLGSDGRTELLGLRWTHWGRGTASGAGVLRENAGPPNKPEYLRSRANVKLSKLEQCDGHRAYSNIRIDSRVGDVDYRGCVPHGVFSNG